MKIARGHDGFVNSLSWHPKGTCLALGGNELAGGVSGKTLNLQPDPFSFTTIHPLSNLGDIQDVRWSPDGRFLVFGGSDKIITLYKNNSVKLVNLIDDIKNLETDCDTLSTVTGELQSQIDACKANKGLTRKKMQDAAANIAALVYKP